MKFYAQLLGFSEIEGGIIQIYPTENQFDIGFVDLYSHETDFNDITFQTKFSDIFKYYPSSNNSVWKLESNMNHLTDEVRLVGSSTLSEDDELWIENERIKILSEISTNYYEIERGINGSIPINHFFSTESYQNQSIQQISATNKRLSPLFTIVKFYSTNNIGSETTILGYGQITDVTLSNNKLITVNCRQLFKQLDKTQLFTNNSKDDYMKVYNFLSYDLANTLLCSTEFTRLLNIPSWFETDFYVECKKINETSQSTKQLKYDDFIKNLIMYNNAFIKFDSENNQYTFQKLGFNTTLSESSYNIYFTNYLNINDSKIEIKPFKRVSTLKGKIKIIDTDEEGKIVIKDYEITLKDDIIDSISSKTIDYDLSNLYFKSDTDINLFNKKLKDKIYFLNQVYDELTISSTRFKKNFEIGKRYVFSDKHILKTLVDNLYETEWICVGFDNNECKFISIETMTRSLVSPFRKLLHSSGSVWVVSPLSKQTSDIILPFESYQTNDIVVVYTRNIIDNTITATTKTLSNVTFSNNFLLTISGLSTDDTTYVHFISYNYDYLTTKNKLFLYENYGDV